MDASVVGRRHTRRWRSALVLLGVALTLLASAAPVSAAGYPPHYCGPDADGRIIWYDGRFWECTHFGGYADQTEEQWFWEPKAGVPYIRGGKNIWNDHVQECVGCNTGNWTIYAPMDWGRATTLKVDYGDWGVSYRTIPQGNGAYAITLSHTFGDLARVVTATILGGAHDGRSNYSVWADP